MKLEQIEEFRKTVNIGDMVQITYRGGFGRIGVKEKQEGTVTAIDNYKVTLDEHFSDLKKYPIYYDTIIKYQKFPSDKPY